MRYGPSVEVEYIDLADTEAQAEFAEVLAVVQAQNLPYPLVAVDGHLKLVGTAHYYHIMPLVEEALQTETVA